MGNLTETIRVSEMSFINVILVSDHEWTYAQYIGFAKKRLGDTHVRKFLILIRWD